MGNLVKDCIGFYKLKCIKEHEDHASFMRLNQIIEVAMPIMHLDIINIGGAHYNISELFNYFTLDGWEFKYD